MPVESSDRAVALIDGMNLFFHAKDAFGYQDPNYDVVKLASVVAQRLGCELVQTRFYVGVPRQDYAPSKHYFWAAKSEAMRQAGVIVYTRPLSRRRPPQEKGIDLRIGLDALALAYERTYDTLIIFSTDQDFTEIRHHVGRLSQLQGREIRLVSSYPVAPSLRVRGINGFEQHPIPRGVYDQCIDRKDYRPRRLRKPRF